MKTLHLPDKMSYRFSDSCCVSNEWKTGVYINMEHATSVRGSYYKKVIKKFYRNNWWVNNTDEKYNNRIQNTTRTTKISLNYTYITKSLFSHTQLNNDQIKVIYDLTDRLDSDMSNVSKRFIKTNWIIIQHYN